VKRDGRCRRRSGDFAFWRLGKIVANKGTEQQQAGDKCSDCAVNSKRRLGLLRLTVGVTLQ